MARLPPSDRDDTATLTAGVGPRGQEATALPARWVLERPVGRGGQAEVWLAHDTVLDQQVAVKVFGAELSATQRERALQEVRLGRTLEHPNLVRIFELLELGARPALIMEWLPGGSLSDRLRRERPTLREVLAIADQALAALAYLHERHIVHRDVKPSNLLFDGAGRLRLSDLGMVRQLDHDGHRLTRTAAAIGTPSYMSPEQIQGLEAGPPSDLYSLGVTLYRLLTGELPFSAASDFELANQHLHSRPPDPRLERGDCPRWFARFIRRLLEKAPRDRWPDASTARRVFARQRVLASPRTVRHTAAAALALAAGAAATAGLIAFRDQEPASVHPADHAVVVRDRTGRELWQQRFEGRVTDAAVADFLGEGSAQVAVAQVVATAPERGGDPSITVLWAGGDERQLVPIGPGVMATSFPRIPLAVARVNLRVTDLDHDGRAELLWWCNNAVAYPAALGLWWPDEGRASQPLLVHSGWIQDVLATDLDGDGRDEIVVAAVNNPLGFQRVVLALEVEWNDATKEYHGAQSPDLRHAANSSDPGLLWYTPLGPTRAGQVQLEASARGVLLRDQDRVVALDAAGNPDGSPLHGTDGAARAARWRLLAEADARLEQGQLAPSAAIQTCLEDESAALAEAPMRLAAELLLARSLARTGHGHDAIEVLRHGVEHDPGSLERRRRLAELLLIDGQRLAGLAELELGLDLAGDQRGPLEGLALVARDAALADDRPRFERARAGMLGNLTDRRRDFGAIWYFDRGDWQAPDLDGDGASEYLPEAAVLRRWAALERGEPAGAIAAEAAALAANPGIRELAGLLQAHTLLRSGGDPARARLLATEALASLRQVGRDRLDIFAWVPLAEWVAGETATASGHAGEAREHFHRAAALAPACWFGQRPKG